MYSALVMLYASYVLEGKWDIENTPTSIRPQIQEIIDGATKKPEGNE